MFVFICFHQVGGIHGARGTAPDIDGCFDAIGKIEDGGAGRSFLVLRNPNLHRREIEFQTRMVLLFHDGSVRQFLANDSVPQAMVEGFLDSSGHLGDRLITAMRAGLSAGGEAGPVRSAGLKLVDKVAWPVAELAPNELTT